MSVLPLIMAAFFAGVLGSLHCIGMCGGIACSVGYLNAKDENDFPAYSELQAFQKLQKKLQLIKAIKFNVGRIMTYSILGGLVGFIGHRFSLLGDSTSILSIFRVVSAVLIALIGFKYLFGLRWVDFLEKAGQKVWTQLNNKLFGTYSLQNAGTLPLGIMWGFLPCGLIYTMLASSVASGSAVAGMLVMLAFGLGTLPSMLGLSVFSEFFRSTMQNRWIQILFGSGFILLAVFLVIGTLSFGSHIHHQ